LVAVRLLAEALRPRAQRVFSRLFGEERGAEVTEVLIVMTVIIAGLLGLLVQLSGTLKNGFSGLTSTIQSGISGL
jgi:Flp pilus assembly pilin Flp